MHTPDCQQAVESEATELKNLAAEVARREAVDRAVRGFVADISDGVHCYLHAHAGRHASTLWHRLFGAPLVPSSSTLTSLTDPPGVRFRLHDDNCAGYVIVTDRYSHLQPRVRVRVGPTADYDPEYFIDRAIYIGARDEAGRPHTERTHSAADIVCDPDGHARRFVMKELGRLGARYINSRRGA